MNRNTLAIVALILVVAVGGVVFALPRVEALRPLRDALLPSSTAVAATDDVSSPASGGSLGAPPAAGGDLNAPLADDGPHVTGGGDDAKDKPAEDEAKKDEKKDDKADEAKKPQTDEEWIAKLEEWKTQDPRAIIESKYDDLDKKKTTPWNEDDPANFIPETGRADPLSPVLSELPDELKQRRGGETDANEIQAYAFSAAASEAVDVIINTLQVYNVVQIGTEKLVTMGVPGGRAFTVSEGSGFNIPYSAGGIAVQVSIQIGSVSTDEVVVVATGSVPRTDASVTKQQVYIPRSF